MGDLALKCSCGCMETRRKNVTAKELGSTVIVIGYGIYCRKCNRYLAHFEHGKLKIFNKKGM